MLYYENMCIFAPYYVNTTTKNYLLTNILIINQILFL